MSGVLAAVAALLLAGAALDPPPAAAATEADRCLGTTFAAIACTSGRFCRAVGEYFAHRGGQGRYCINGWNDADS